MSLDGKIALVTGASRGIGRDTAIKLSGLGVKVVGTATSEAGAQKITEYFKESNLDGVGIKLNLSDPSGINDVLVHMKGACGLPDILVNNAGITRDNIMMRMTDEQWDDVIQTNLSSIFRLSKACLRPMMKKKWGRIISIGSVVGLSGNPGQANYCAAKAGLIGFSKALAIEIASRNITVNVVAPGFIQTDMTGALNDEQQKAIMSKIPSGKMGLPSDIASAVAFLASDGAGYITGNTLNVNGGMYMQ
ncbi:MAG: 3-oxoacyl-[acyl-carrier protein] reductase [Francisellaceae bacterium]|jgi:3-oxoacyl-[acyl-carrier protein] reductase